MIPKICIQSCTISRKFLKNFQKINPALNLKFEESSISLDESERMFWIAAHHFWGRKSKRKLMRKSMKSWQISIAPPPFPPPKEKKMELWKSCYLRELQKNPQKNPKTSQPPTCHPLWYILPSFFYDFPDSYSMVGWVIEDAAQMLRQLASSTSLSSLWSSGPNRRVLVSIRYIYLTSSCFPYHFPLPPFQCYFEW